MAAWKKELTPNQAMQFYAVMLTLVCMCYRTSDVPSVVAYGFTATGPLLTSIGVRAFCWGLLGLPVAIGVTDVCYHLHHLS